MKIIECEQNTPEWEAARIGLPTASLFDKIITATGKASSQAEAYANRLIAELLIGKPIKEWEGNGWSDRGHELEHEAAQYYEALCDLECVPVGFCTDDNRTMGCSPDRLVGDEGLLEIKCPSAHIHMKYVFHPEELEKEYRVQTQGQLLVTARKWADLLSYFPELPPVLVRVTPDMNYLMSMTKELSIFNKMLENKRQQLISNGYKFHDMIDDDGGKYLMGG